jgi:hypothetical protein
VPPEPLLRKAPRPKTRRRRANPGRMIGPADPGWLMGLASQWQAFWAAVADGTPVEDALGVGVVVPELTE